MSRSRLLAVLLALLALLLRATSPPVYLGQLDGPPPDRLHALTAPLGDDLRASSEALLALLAQSIVREGLRATGGVPLFNVAKAAPDDFCWYDHHPPGVPLVTAAAFRLFGDSEAVGRAIALLFATLTLGCVTAFVQRTAGSFAAVAAAVGLALPPIGWYWAAHLDFPVPTLAACTVFLVHALKPEPTRTDRTVAAIALAFGVLFDFLALLAAVAAAVEGFFARPGRRWRTLLGWPLLGGLYAALVVAWLAFAVRRYGHTPGPSTLANILAIWQLPDGAGFADLLGRVGGHLLALLGLIPLAVAVIGIALAFLSRGHAELRRLVRAGLWLALLAGLLPRARAWDHAYFQLYAQLPAALACGLVARTLLDLGGARLGGALITAMLLLIGATGTWAELVRQTPATDRPAAARLGRELAAAVPDPATVIALPADSGFAEFVPTRCAGRLVLTLPAGSPPSRASLLGMLRLLGLEGAAVVLARDPRWPGRGGLVPLPAE